ncbi:MAG TPA: CocE/NonD family hydrolase [Mycobacteriales bacterium]|nr:CocE/NonD family hydrolase [Mycobacteriales bacterium]
MRRSARLSAALAAVVLVLVPAPPVAAEEVEVTSGTASVVNGPAGSPEIELEYDLYLPEGASAEDPRPAVVMTNGFGLDKGAAEVTSMSSFLARNGYVVLAYTAAGFSGSGGCITLQSIDRDAIGTQQLVDEVLDVRDDVLRDADGELVLGTVGGSYGGGWQLPFAALDERVKAAAPGRTWQSLRYALNPNNRVVPGDATRFAHPLNEQGVFKLQWTSLFFAAGNGEPVGGIPPTPTPPRTACTEYKLATADPAEVAGAACTGYLAELCALYARIVTTGDTTAADRQLLDRASGATFLEELGARRLPVLLVQGQRDTLFNPNDALTAYTALRTAGSPVEMVWNWGGHGGYNSRPGECEVYGGGTGAPDPSPTGEGLEDCYLTARTLDFFDRHLRGEPGSAPGFAWYRDAAPFAEGADGDVAADEQYGTAAAYPAMPSTAFALSGSDSLVPPGGDAAAGSVRLVNPPGGQPSSYSETSNFTGPSSNPRDPRPPYDLPGQSASFTSAPFAEAVESVGVPTARLQLSHAAPTDLVLFGKVYDVAPDGTAELVHRLVSPVRVPTAALGEPVEMNLVGFAHRFEAGHSVRFTVTTTDMAYRNNPVPDVVTLATGPGSTFSLPLPAGATAPPPAAPTDPGAGAGATPPAQARGQLPATGAGAVLPLAAVLLLAGAVAARRTRG